ncbi:acyloxyacyl hydrolase [Halomonas sp.]|uniref:acyloxyacyl hydrolase n=1 Tax=Halomonas sp. TaxID=1486246 RepID=UPI003566C7C6
MSRHNTAIAAIATATLLGSSPTLADWSLAAGATSESTAALQIQIDHLIPLEGLHPRLDLRLATGLLMLSSEKKGANAAWLVTPAVRYTFMGEREVFLEAGIGGALFIDTRLDARELSTSFQFEDRLALGLPWADGEISLALIHYSNAGIRRPNDGFETLMLGYRVSL